MASSTSRLFLNLKRLNSEVPTATYHRGTNWRNHLFRSGPKSSKLKRSEFLTTSSILEGTRFLRLRSLREFGGTWELKFLCESSLKNPPWPAWQVLLQMLGPIV